MDTPSWLSGGNGTQPAASAPPTATPSAAVFEVTQSGADRAAAGPDTASSNVDESDLPSMILVMRLANIGAAAALMTCSVSALWTMQYKYDALF